MADLESAQNTREKTYWTRHILRKWSLFDLERAKALQKSGHSADAAFLLGEVFKRSPSRERNYPLFHHFSFSEAILVSSECASHVSWGEVAAETAAHIRPEKVNNWIKSKKSMI